MKTGPRYHVKSRRHRNGRTNYHRRLRLLKSQKPRIVVRRSLQQIRVQFVQYHPQGDKILTSALSKELVKQHNWKGSTANTAAAYLTGVLAGKRAQEQGISEAILDIGRYRPTKGNRIFAALKGAVDAGVHCPCDETMIPDEQRILGTHLKNKPKPSVETIRKIILGGE